MFGSALCPSAERVARHEALQVWGENGVGLVSVMATVDAKATLLKARHRALLPASVRPWASPG